MDCSFLRPDATDWSPNSLVLDLYSTHDALTPSRVDLMEFMSIGDDVDKAKKYNPAKVRT